MSVCTCVRVCLQRELGECVLKRVWTCSLWSSVRAGVVAALGALSLLTYIQALVGVAPEL